MGTRRRNPRARPLHFAVDYSGETLCGKSTSRTRKTYSLSVWGNTVIAAGRRCPECASAVERRRESLKD